MQLQSFYNRCFQVILVEKKGLHIDPSCRIQKAALHLYCQREKGTPFIKI